MFKVDSTDNLSFIEIKLIDLDKNLPSIGIALKIQNQGFSARLSEVWINWGIIEEFLIKSKDLAYGTHFCFSLESLSPDEMKLEMQQLNAELVSLKYTVSKTLFEQSLIRLIGSFDLGLEKIDEIRNAFTDIAIQFK